MASTKTLTPLFILRSLQALLAFIVLGLSAELIKGHNLKHYNLSHVPKLLPFVAGVGGLTVGGALVGFVLAWTEFLRGYFEVIIDTVILLANLVGGVLLAIQLQGKNCADASTKNRYGSDKPRFPFKGGLAGIDILNGGCNGHVCLYTDISPEQLNARCKKSQVDSVFMFLTVVVLLVILALTYMRMKRA